MALPFVQFEVGAHSSFESHMDEIIAKKPKAAALGGLPGFENKARAYVDALFRTEDKQGYTELRSKFSVEVR